MCTINLAERNSERLNKVIASFLIKRHLLDRNLGWEVRESPVGGFGVFATKDFDVGEVIFKDSPVIIGPRCVPNCLILCVNCYSKTNLQACKKGCGLDVCGKPCQNSQTHLKECKFIRQHRQKNPSSSLGDVLYGTLTPLRSLFLDTNDREVVSCLIAHDRGEHGHEIDTLKSKLGFQLKEDDEKFMRFVCCVLDANAFEVTLGNEECQTSLRGLYPLASLANHSCVPNTIHVFDDQQRMIVRSSVFVRKGSEVFHSYARIIWGTTTRLYHLQETKRFICKCPRCKDPTEFGTYMGSVLCKLCRGVVSPVDPYKAHASWQCGDCKSVVTGKDIGQFLTLLGSILRNIKQDDFPFMYKFLKGKLRSVVPENNQVATELRYKIVWVLGHKEGYKWHELPLDLLEIKEQICNQLLNLLEKLRCGQSKMRGLLLHELFCCKREALSRVDASGKQNSENIRELINEAADILKYDVTAPEEIKDLLQKDPHLSPTYNAGINGSRG